MTFAQLALANVRGSWMRYAAFFLSSSFSVMLFYLYAQFVLHPDLAAGYLYGGDTTRTVLIVCMVLITLFAFLFVLYSSGAFLLARNQEFGLLTLMGTTRAQLRRLIWLENTFLSLASLIAGLGLGILFSRLFLLAIARVLVLEEPLRFAVSPSALALTGAGFFLLFQFVTLAGSFRVGRSEVVDLLKAARQPRPTPRASVPLAIVGFLLVGGGYAVAILAQGSQAVALAFLPTVLMVVVGTYLVFTQGSLFVLRRLQRPASGYLAGTRLLVVSQLVFRMRDNARLLATIATLSAVVLSAAGTFYVITRTLAKDIDLRFPQPLVLFEPDGEGRSPVSAAELEALLGEHGIAPSLRLELDVRQLEVVRDAQAADAVLVARSQYDALVATVGQPPAAPGLTLGGATPPATSSTSRLAFTDGGEVVAEPVTASVTQIWSLGNDWYALTDEDFAALPAHADALTGRLTFYDWPGSQRTSSDQMKLGAALSDAFAAQDGGFIASRMSMESITTQTLGLSMFAGLFVSLLFFIGAGSLIYFKLFTELPDDRRQFTRLRRIGITRRESDHVVTAQIALIYLLPFAVGSVHSLVALNALGSVLQVNVWQYSVVVVALFAAVQLGFMGLTRWTYLRALLLRA